MVKDEYSAGMPGLGPGPSGAPMEMNDVPPPPEIGTIQHHPVPGHGYGGYGGPSGIGGPGKQFDTDSPTMILF